ncbi:MAG: hypothetical protein M3Z02_11740 [Actinomycetota bacterium]|nr:hypothetical protein [Actinomycetota bacterium]
MANHFDCVGLDVPDAEAYVDLTRWVLANAPAVPDPATGRAETVWTDPSGARFSVQVSNEPALVGSRPSYAGRTRLPFRAVRWVREDTVVGDVLAGDEVVYPLAVEIENPVAARRLDLAEVVAVAVTAFAEVLTVHADETAFRTAQTAEPRFAAQSLVPSGLVSADGAPRDPRAEILMNGRVGAALPRRNGHTGRTFWHAAVRTLGGDLDVVAAPEQVPDGLALGNIVSGSFWVVGRLVTSRDVAAELAAEPAPPGIGPADTAPGPPPRRGLLRRLRP